MAQLQQQQHGAEPEEQEEEESEQEEEEQGSSEPSTAVAGAAKAAAAEAEEPSAPTPALPDDQMLRVGEGRGWVWGKLPCWLWQCAARGCWVGARAGTFLHAPLSSKLCTVAHLANHYLLPSTVPPFLLSACLPAPPCCRHSSGRAARTS